MKKLVISVDVEPDCPPFLQSMRGIEEGLPQLLELFDQTGITVTFFTTGQVAEQYPELIKRIPQGGHELGCHGYSHKRFDRMNEKEARADLKAARTILEQLCPEMDSFRAPNLKFPPGYVGLLEEQGFTIDSSLALYKPPFARRISRIGGITRLPVTLTSSLLRLPLPMILPLLMRLKDAVVFVHPWEFIDMSKTPVRFDCKFNTGIRALENLTAMIQHLKLAGYRFLSVRERIKLARPSWVIQ
jgi:peptidoglycan/xylan/chitin deacetylase (PgdA/CDA1 family)